MAATLLSIRTDVRLGIGDTDSSNYAISDAQLNNYINRAVRRINAETLFNEKSGSISADGVNYGFTLASSMTDFLAMRGAYYASGQVIDGAVDISEIRALFASGGLVGGSPTKYALYAGKIWFDAIPASGVTISVDYCGVPTDMTADGNSPATPLPQFDGLIVAATKLEIADDLHSYADILVSARPVYEDRKRSFVSLIESGGKHQTLGNSITRRRI